MDCSLHTKEVIAMYDVRGIQDYIFRTNKIKDIIGASCIIEGIIQKALSYAIHETGMNDQDVVLNWDERNTLEYLTNSALKLEVLFIGGGNAFVLFRCGQDCEQINRQMARYVLDQTYSLQLAVAVVEKTDNYDNDMAHLHEKMEMIKSTMGPAITLGALPIVRSEAMTGNPVSAKENGEWLSEETVLKRKQAKCLSENIDQEMMVTKKGSDSTVAVVHLDGNNMGVSIQKLMEGITDYENAVNKQRQISRNINHCFTKVFNDMCDWFRGQLKEQGLDESKIPNYLRKIILAGDDLTFLCNGKYALSLVNYIANAIEKESIWEGYPFSIGAGIAYIHNHYPFSIGYEAAEACCRSAKARGKLPENLVNGKVGSWVDFHICKNVQAKSLSDNRKKHYLCNDGSYLLKRPYCLNNEASDYSFVHFEKVYQYFSDTKKIPRSMAKDIRNHYSLGENNLEPILRFVISRKGAFPPEIGDAFTNVSENGIEVKRANWYDALEMLELFEK